MFAFDFGGETFDEIHVLRELLQVEERAETETPENREYVHGEEVRVGDLCDLGEDSVGSHHDCRFLGFDSAEEGDDFLLHSVFVEDGAVGGSSSVWSVGYGGRGAPAENAEGFQATDLNGEAAGFAENRSYGGK